MRHVRFGPFELRTDTRELSKAGTRIKLQSKPEQILEILISRPGELVKREDICEQLWPRGVFVDVESGLNTAVNRLRSALGDIAETPFYIETIPRLGYRFICSVQDVSSERSDADPVQKQQAVFMEINLPFDRFMGDMLLRLVLATMLAFVCQFAVFYWVK